MSNTEFEIQGISHIALVSGDMARTVAFYNGVLGMPVVKTFDQPLPGRHGQQFFFDIGDGTLLDFFYFPGMPERAPGIAAPARPGTLDSAIGSMQHLAFNIRKELFHEYRKKLEQKGIEYVYIAHDLDGKLLRDPSEYNDETFAESVYFQDPDGIVLEFCSWCPAFERLKPDQRPMSAEVPA